ncbi:trypsin-like peptidase domain-containing protein [Candidatus Pacearchaeota archaeon]|nr:trypsin-like peptidase domain-containing protein [Candidatus Pacearchaeota archaeon]
MVDHKKHRNILYSLVVILALLQIISFLIISVQFSNLNSKLDSEIEKTNLDLKKFTTDLIQTYNSLYQENFNDISMLLTKQEKDFEQEISLLKSTQEDFSGIINEAIVSVVTVSTGDSVGSGFIIDSSGYIVTNYHVIQGREDNIRVLTYDRELKEAELINKDELRDLALLKIQGDYKEIALANSDELQVGKKVIAIGNPLGLSFTVTEGIISAIDRAGPNGLAEYIQTDVSLNPGNSGGPLIDTNGKVVGINNFKIGDAESLGFALESNSIRESVNSMLEQTIIP